MFLPPSSEKAQLTPLSKQLPNKITEKAVFFVQSQALPVGWSVLKFSLGLSGIFNVFAGSTALADTGFQSPNPTEGTTAAPSLASLGLGPSASPENTNRNSNYGDRAKRQASHPQSPLQSPLWKTARSAQTPSSTELSFHPAPLLTDMGSLTRTLTSDEAIAHNQHPEIQTEPQQPKFSTGSTSRTAPEAQPPEAQQNTASETPTRAHLPRDKPPLDIAKLSEQITLSALSQPTIRHPIAESSVGEATPQPETQPDISLDALIAGNLGTQSPAHEENPVAKDLIADVLVTEEISNSAEGIPSEIEAFPESNQQEGTDIGPGVLPDELEAPESETPNSENAESNNTDASNELGTLRVQPTRSRASEELGILRLMQTAQAPPPPPKPPISFLTGRLGFFSSGNAFRSNPRIDESIYQSGLAYYLFPKLSDKTSLYAIAETNLARYDQFQSVNYNELEVQLGVRQRLLPRTYAQVGWRNQRLYSPGYREKLFSVNYIDAMVSHRSILNSKTWVDGFYQARLGFANPETASRFRQTFTVSLNYGATRDLRTSLLYQLDFDDYTQVSRYDTYQQLLGIISYNLTPESRISVFGGTRFGRSSSPGVSLDDTFYGAGLNVSVPLF